MASLSALRIKRELKEIMQWDEIMRGLVKIEPINDNWMELRGEISGLKDTPYEGGKFSLEIKIPDEYPFSPPKIRFTTRIWHPNVSYVSGSICKDMLKDNWAAAMTLRTVLLSLQALLSAAEPDEPQNAIVGIQYKEKPDLFNMTAKHWTNAYAGGPHKIIDCDAKIMRLKDMGADVHEARIMLSKVNWNLEVATESLLR